MEAFPLSYEKAASICTECEETVSGVLTLEVSAETDRTTQNLKTERPLYWGNMVFLSLVLSRSIAKLLTGIAKSYTGD